jgi:hypothetical protein
LKRERPRPGSERLARRFLAFVVVGMLIVTLPEVSVRIASAGAVSSSPLVLAGGGDPTEEIQITSAKNYSSPVVLPSDFYGVNVRVDQPFNATDATYLADTDALTWRYPGGDIGEDYNYTTDTQPTTGTLEPNNISNFAAQCTAVHCRAILQLPAEIDDPSTDAYYVSYIEHSVNYTVGGTPYHGFTPWLWEFGNEPSLWANFGYAWTEWSTEAPLNATPTTYANTVMPIIDAIRSVDPTTPIDPLAGVGGGSTGDAAWISAVLGVAKTNAQYISIHSYLAGSTERTTTAGFYSSLYQSDYVLGSLLPKLYAAILSACSACSNVGILVSEAGASNGETNANYETSFPMAMWDASEAIQASAGNAASIDYFAYRNSYPGSWMNLSGDLEPSYYFSKDVLPFLGSTVLNVTLNSTDSGRLLVGGWWGPADNWSLLLVNLDTENSTHVGIAGSGFPVHAAIEYYRWNGTPTDPLGGETSWLNSTLVPPDSMELIVAYPPGSASSVAAPRGLFIPAVNLSAIRIDYQQPAGPVLYDSVTYGTPTSTAPYCAPSGVFSAANSTGGVTVSGLNMSRPHCFAVRAWTSAGAGPLSAYVNQSALPPLPAAPKGLTVTAVSDDSVSLSWTNPGGGGLRNDTIYEGSPGCSYSERISLGGAADAGVAPVPNGATTYCFAVQAWNVSGGSPLSAPVTATSLPDPPSKPVVTGSTRTSLQLSWSNPSGSLTDSYLFWQNTSTCESPVEVNLGSVASSYTLDGLTSGITYCFLAAASSAGGIGPESPLGLGTTAEVPAAPTGLAAVSVTLTSVGLTWTNPPGGGLVNETVYEGPADCQFNATTSLNAVSESDALPGLSPGASYCFAVQAWNATGASALSEAVTTTTLTAPPSGLSGVPVSTASIRWSWTDPEGDLTAISLYWNQGRSCGAANRVGLGAVSTDYVLGGLTADTWYCAYVESVTAGGASAPSSVVNVLTASVPAAPSQPSVTGSSATSISLSWVEPSTPGLLNNTVWYGTSCAALELRDSTDGAATQYTVTGLASGEIYCFAVQAWNASGGSPLSPSLAAATPGVPPAATGLRAAQVGVDFANLTWNDPTSIDNVTLYENSVDCSLANATATSEGSEAQSAHVTGLLPATSYCFGVRVWNASGGSDPTFLVVVTLSPTNQSGPSSSAQDTFLAIAGVILGGSAALGVWAYLRGRKKSADPTPPAAEK